MLEGIKHREKSWSRPVVVLSSLAGEEGPSASCSPIRSSLTRRRVAFA